MREGRMQAGRAEGREEGREERRQGVLRNTL